MYRVIHFVALIVEHRSSAEFATGPLGNGGSIFGMTTDIQVRVCLDGQGKPCRHSGDDPSSPDRHESSTN